MTLLRFAIKGTNLFYEVPEGVANPPVFDIKNGVLRILSYGYLPHESIFEIAPNGQLTISYDLSGYTEAEQWVYRQARSIMGLTDDNLLLDSYLLYYVKGIEQFIRNYCAVREVPRELWYVWVEMVSAKAQANKNGFASFDNATAKTIKDGSQSITYGECPAAAIAGLSQAEVTEFLNGWGHQLRQHRRFKWG